MPINPCTGAPGATPHWTCIAANPPGHTSPPGTHGTGGKRSLPAGRPIRPVYKQDQLRTREGYRGVAAVRRRRSARPPRQPLSNMAFAVVIAADGRGRVHRAWVSKLFSRLGCGPWGPVPGGRRVPRPCGRQLCDAGLSGPHRDQRRGVRGYQGDASVRQRELRTAAHRERRIFHLARPARITRVPRPDDCLPASGQKTFASTPNRSVADLAGKPSNAGARRRLKREIDNWGLCEDRSGHRWGPQR